MPVNKKPRLVSDPAPGVAPADDDVVNIEWLAEVGHAICKINETWPDLAVADPLPLQSTEQVGFMAPFDAQTYTSQRAGDRMQYGCGINLLWQNTMASVTPKVPLSKARILELAEGLEAGVMMKPNMVILADFANGEALPRGALNRISPPEPPQALVIKVAQRINGGATAHELLQWKRVLLSVPCIFERVDSVDMIYARACDIRLEHAGIARAVQFSARQTIYSIISFKQSKEIGGMKFSAELISQFYDAHVKKIPGQEALHRKSTIDAAITIHERLFSIPECELMIHQRDEMVGPKSTFNSIWKLQEIVSRGQTRKKITCLVEGFIDMLKSGKMTDAEITTAAIKGGSSKSMSDVIFQMQRVKSYLMGEWLDSTELPSYMKQRVRAIFGNISTYRSLYNPYPGGSVDLTWLNSWPKYGKE